MAQHRPADGKPRLLAFHVDGAAGEAGYQIAADRAAANM
jgi:hypothetical protein